MCTIDFDHLHYMDAVLAQMNSASSRPTMYTITKARLCKECRKFSNISNPINIITNNGRVLDVGTEIRLKINIHVVNKDYLTRIQVSLGRWRSHQRCFRVWTIGKSSRRGCLGTTVTVLTFLWGEIRQQWGVAILSKIDLFILLLFQYINWLFPVLQLSNDGLARERFFVPSIPLVLPSAANGEVAIILILHTDVTYFTPKPFSVFYIYLWALIICLRQHFEHTNSSW